MQYHRQERYVNNGMTTIRIRQAHRTLLVELASRISLANGSHCSMTEALDMLLDYSGRRYTAKQLADLLLDGESNGH